VEIGCDGINALRDCFNSDAGISCDKPHFDLIAATRTLQDLHPIRWLFRHIYGHQDDTVEFTDLDRWAQLNTLCDLEAKRIGKDYAGLGRRLQYRVAYEPWSIWIGDEKLSHSVSERTRDAIDGLRCIQRWEKRRKFGTASSRDVDWDAVDKLMSALAPKRGRWLTKHSHGMSGVGKFMVRYHLRASSKCPHCALEEDATHVWTCQSQAVQDKWTQALDDLNQWLHDTDTAPDLIVLILDGLRAWSGNQTNPTSPRYPDLAGRQAGLGWQSLFEGRPAVGWQTAQQDYFAAIGSSNRGLRWLTQLLLKLVNIAWDLWEFRNDVLYTAQQTLAYELQLSMIDEEFAYRHLHTPTDHRRFFGPGAAEIKERPPHLRSAWLHRVHSALTRQRLSNADRARLDQADEILSRARRWLRPRDRQDDE